MHIKYDPEIADPETLLDLKHDLLAAELIRAELTDSDYVVVKIAEAIAEGNTAEADRIRTEHAADLERRKLLRKLINDIKAKWETS